MGERIVVAECTSKDARAEAKRRADWDVTFKVEKDEYELDPKYYKDENTTVLGESDGLIEVKRDKRLDEMLEDRVWSMFYEIQARWLPIRRTIAEYDSTKKPPLTQQIDGLFADAHHVYIVECKYRQRRAGQLRRDNSLREILKAWQGIFPRLTARLGKRPEFNGKEFHFILATQGVLVDGTVASEGQGFAHFLDSTTVDQISELGKKMGEGARSVLHQHLFKGREIPGKPVDLAASRIKQGSRSVYSFFANANQLMDLAYIHRKEPANADLSTAYQRFVKPSKVASISEFLGRPETFFANSIVVSVEKPNFVISTTTDEGAELGLLTLPNRYGSIWVIDGQHRLFGSAATTENRKKLFPVVAIDGLNPIEQSELFRTINEKQTKIPPDLLWDIYGDLGSEIEPTSDTEKEGYRKRVISRVWKRINAAANHPFAGRIVIPSQTTKTGDCFMQFAYLCDMLDFEELWKEGRLRGDSFASAENFAYKRLSAFLTDLNLQFPDEWKEPRQSFLLKQYSMRVILQIFRYGVVMFSEAKYSKHWTSDPETLLSGFGQQLAKAIRKKSIDYEGRIPRAGNAQVRQDIVIALVHELQVSYPQLAPNIESALEAEPGDEGQSEPDTEISRRTKALERSLRDLCHNVLFAAERNGWWSKVPKLQKERVEEDIRLRRAHGDTSITDKPTREWLDSSTLSDLLQVLTAEKNWTLFQAHLGGVHKAFEQYYGDFMLLRNLVAHDKKYPSPQAKARWIAALERLEDLATRFPEKPTSEPAK